MREIKFRGKRPHSGDWLYGSLYFSPIWTAIHDRNISTCWDGFIEVDPATVGQYTGLKDKHGVEIYEGDMLHHKWDSGNAIYLETISEVKFSRGAFVVDDKKRADWLLSLHALPKWAEIEVIGNIHDNPDLLEVTE